MNQSPLISVITVSYRNTSEQISNLVDTVSKGAARANATVEFHLIDNSASDIQLARAQENIFVHKSIGNVGFGRACNYLARRSNGEYLFFLNPDAVVVETTLTSLLNSPATDADASSMSVGWLISPTGHLQSDAYLSWFLSWSRLLRRRSAAKKLIADTTKYVKVKKACGGALFMRKSIFESLGGFDESFFLYGEDHDLSIRAIGLGVTIYAVKNAVVIHEGAYSQSSVGAMVERARVDAALRIVNKHRGRLGRYVAALDIATVTLAGMLSKSNSSESQTARLARYRELARWLRWSTPPRFCP